MTEPVHLFIDANILLGFYHLQDDDLEELKKLKVAIDNKKVVLYLCQQLVDETRRNRDIKIEEAMKTLRGAGLKIQAPVFARHFAQYDTLQEKLIECRQVFSELLKACENGIDGHSLEADKLISSLFDVAFRLDDGGAIFMQAVERYRRGNPPGKKKSTLGDEIIWESLLNGVPDGVELHLVSKDGDYQSTTKPGIFHSFLQNEWTEKKGVPVRYYPALSSFFRENFPEIKLADDIPKLDYVMQLVDSLSFASTHHLIGELSKFNSFTPYQAEWLVYAANRNQQVNWIFGDDDVLSFYKTLLENWDDAARPEFKTLLEHLIEQVSAFTAATEQPVVPVPPPPSISTS